MTKMVDLMRTFIFTKLLIPVIYIMGNVVIQGQEIKYYEGIHDIDAYFFHGYNAIADPLSLDICFKFTYSNNKLIKIETQQKGVTKNLFFSNPAITEYEYRNNEIVIRFKDENNNPWNYENIDSCIIKTDKILTLYRARFYKSSERVSDYSKRYEVVYHLENGKITSWENYNPMGKLQNLTFYEFAKCKIEYNQKSQITKVSYYDKSNNPAILKGIDWRGVECGSPDPGSYYYYSIVKYGYNKYGSLVNTEYYDSKNKKVFER